MCLFAWIALLGATASATPLHQAVRSRDIGTLKTLLESRGGKEVNAVIAGGITPLHLAAATDQTDIAALLIARGADVRAASTTGFTPLHWAASRDSVNTIRLLLEAGANINAMAQKGITPLHWAAAKHAVKAVRVLIEAGADLTAVTATGDTPLHLAFKQDHDSKTRTPIAALVNTLQAGDTGVTDADTPPTSPDAILTATVPSDWMQEKTRLEQQLQALNDTTAKDAERLKQMEQELGQARQASADLAAQVKDLGGRKVDIRESDLYKDLEQINSLLREKMVDIESERQRLALAAENAAKGEAEQSMRIGTETQARAKADAALAEALAREAEYKELIERLVPQVDELERQVTALTQERAVLTNRMRERDEDVQSLRVELERREYRLARAERVADVLEKARTEVLRAGDREKLNMHYNMAAVYAREGKSAEAEREYLRALRIDPTDADVHYNLGILYDDEMKQPEKATLHYRRYLQLSPHGPDADRVRNWLMKLEMRTR